MLGEFVSMGVDKGVEGPAKLFTSGDGTKLGPLVFIEFLNHEAKNLVVNKDNQGVIYLRKSLEILCHRCERNKRKVPTRRDGWT